MAIAIFLQKETWQEMLRTLKCEPGNEMLQNLGYLKMVSVSILQSVEIKWSLPSSFSRRRIYGNYIPQIPWKRKYPPEKTIPVGRSSANAYTSTPTMKFTKKSTGRLWWPATENYTDANQISKSDIGQCIKIHWLDNCFPNARRACQAKWLVARTYSPPIHPTRMTCISNTRAL
jgi:hypothetical protein